MLFPQNYLTIPFLSLFFNKMLALQPIMKALAVLFAEPFLLFDSQYVVPSHLPTLMGSGSAEEDLTAEVPPQSSCSDQASHVYASQDHPPSLTHYQNILLCL